MPATEADSGQRKSASQGKLPSYAPAGTIDNIKGAMAEEEVAR